jgi:hypothetical protein
MNDASLPHKLPESGAALPRFHDGRMCLRLCFKYIGAVVVGLRFSQIFDKRHFRAFETAMAIPQRGCKRFGHDRKFGFAIEPIVIVQLHLSSFSFQLSSLLSSSKCPHSYSLRNASSMR